MNSADASSEQQEPTPQETLNLAMRYHTAGHLPEAETIYQQILRTEPNHPDALHLLGVVSHQAGKNDRAVDLITKALAIKPGFAEAHNNLGIVLQDLGKPHEAMENYHKALAINPDYVEAYYNLGNTLKGLVWLDEAAAIYQRALNIKPDFVQAHSNLGAALEELGRMDEAIVHYRKAIAINPDFAMAHNNLGNLLKKLGQLDEAVASYQKAIAIECDYTEAHNNLGAAFRELGRLDEAFTCYRRAVTLDPHREVFWAGLAVSLETLSFTSIDDKVLQDLLHLLEQPTVNPVYVAQPIISALRCHQEFSQLLELIGSEEPEIRITYGDVAEQLSEIPLFLRIIRLSPINDLEIERMLTFLRHAMLQETAAERTDEKGLPFSAALALHCFVNEYIFQESTDETAAVEQLHQEMTILLAKGQDVPPSFVTTLAAYRPLHIFSWAQELCERDWTDIIKEVIDRQISEPLGERSLRSKIPQLTSIRNTISQLVREQYEENPYPRWIKTGLADKGRTIGVVFEGAPLYFDLGEYVSPESPEILVAGCGTGQHSLITASRFSNARVLAVDLSLSSLSYAMRKTSELGFSNIEYAQADIMELGDLGRQFDLIECVGVLHHLDDPLAGWQVLVDLLQPGGLMKIGLYSETARQNIIAGRSLIVEKGYTASPDNIRRCRQDIISKGEDGDQEMLKLSNGIDFFSLSNCRDLLFHVQEHRFKPSQVETALQFLKLKFLGFGMRDQRAIRKFRQSHPSKQALTSLSLWHKFELEYPDTFTNTYQFWCKKM